MIIEIECKMLNQMPLAIPDVFPTPKSKSEAQAIAVNPWISFCFNLEDILSNNK